MKSLIICTASLYALFAPLTALADEIGEDVQFRFFIEETQSPTAAASLFERIQYYAQRKCRYASDRNIPAKDADECAAELTAQFVAQIDAPLLSLAANKAEREVELASAK